MRKMELERIGEVGLSVHGEKMKIVRYANATDIDVQFLDEYGYVAKGCTYHFFKKGLIKNPMRPRLYGVGYLGMDWIQKQDKFIYSLWASMLRRCFDKTSQMELKWYEEVQCDERFLCYCYFYDWVISQPNFKILKEKKLQIQVDKDIKHKGNKIYSPDMCLIVYTRINNLILRNQEKRGNLPIGVKLSRNKTNPYCARLKKNTGKSIHLGYFKTPEEAFYAYKEAKEAYIKEVADEEYALGNITKECRDALYAYTVEITD